MKHCFHLYLGLSSYSNHERICIYAFRVLWLDDDARLQASQHVDRLLVTLFCFHCCRHHDPLSYLYRDAHPRPLL